MEVQEQAQAAEEAERFKARKVVIKGVAREWNSIVANLLKIDNAWKKYCQLRLDHGVHIEEFPIEAQKILMLANPKGDFDFILEEMITRGKHLKEFLKTQFILIK